LPFTADVEERNRRFRGGSTGASVARAPPYIRQYVSSPLLPEGLRQTLRKRIVDSHDFSIGGLRQQPKFMDRDTVEYALMLDIFVAYLPIPPLTWRLLENLHEPEEQHP